MNLKKYFEFIKKCKNNNPEKYHTHHIIPRYMGGSNDDSNLIELSYEDHYIAHIILAECFEPGSYHYNRNVWAALRLSGWKNDSELSEKLSLARKGKTYEELFGTETAKKIKEKLSKHWRDYWNQPQNKERKKIFMSEHNPMKTLKFSDISIKKMSDARKDWWNEISNEELSILRKNRSMISKKWWSNLSDIDKEKISEKKSISMKNWWDSTSNEIIEARNKKYLILKEGSQRTQNLLKNGKEI